MIYNGTLNQKKMIPAVLVAYNRWAHQRKRCNNKNNKSYKDYGAKGIRIEYTSREFIGWYLEKIENFKGIKPTIGRIDHSKNYTLDNIEIQEWSENSKERNDRCGNPNPKKIVKIYKNGLFYRFAESTYHASKLTGLNQSYISKICNRKNNGKKFNFEYIE